MGLFDKIGRLLSGAVNMAGDMARRSDDPNVACQYIGLFSNKVESADLETLEKMLERREYEVTLDSENDIERRARILERIDFLRKERSRQVAEERNEFDRWLSTADVDALEAGLSCRKYQICFDGENDSSRKTRLEQKLRPLQEERERREREEREKADCARMRQFFRDYLIKTQAEIYKSYDVFCDFQKELGCLADFQEQVLDELYAGQVQELLSKTGEERQETLSNFCWQINRRKTVAGKSLILLLLAERAAQGEYRSLLHETLKEMEEAVLRNACSGFLEEEDRALSADSLLEKGKRAACAGDPKKAAAFYLAAGEAQTEAMYRLGFCFLYGLGVPVNYERAFQLLSKSAQRESPEGVYGLGVCYRWGYGVAQDSRRAEELFRQADALGCAAGAYALGEYYKEEGDSQDLPAALGWYKRSANQGCLNGMYFTYACYCDGLGTEKDDSLAGEWLTRLTEAAGQESAPLDITAFVAFNNLGLAFHHGWGGTGGQDEERALEWFKKSAAAGNRAGKTWLIDFDEYEGRNRILKELEEENYPWSFEQLADYYDSGKGLPEDKVLASCYYLKAAKYGRKDAQYRIGMGYLEGRPGIRQDAGQAVFWLEKAAAQGADRAKEELEKYRESVERQQKEREQEQERARREKQAAECQARRSSALEEKAALKGRMAGLLQRQKEIEEKIDSAASEKEEAAAIAEKEAVQGEIDRLSAQMEQADALIAALENEEE